MKTCSYCGEKHHAKYQCPAKLNAKGVKGIRIYRGCKCRMSPNCMDEYYMESTELTKEQEDRLYWNLDKIQDILPPSTFSPSFREGAKGHMPMCPACQVDLYGEVKLNDHESFGQSS